MIHRHTFRIRGERNVRVYNHNSRISPLVMNRHGGPLVENSVTLKHNSLYPFGSDYRSVQSKYYVRHRKNNSSILLPVGENV